MEKKVLREKMLRLVLGSAVVIITVGLITFLGLYSDKPLSAVFADITRSTSSMSKEDINNAYMAAIKKEDARHKAIESAINKKYDSKIKAIKDKLDSYTDKSSKEYFDCQSDLTVLQGQQFIETEQEIILNTQNEKCIYDNYYKKYNEK